ncbi:outer membrane biogenesis protein BamB [Limihaloglobus sulfuriphilus]|uniref:Outer membrane biogenesis protein BamB n=1 Tax=Limihaloglobus sulfuriphilus TaxID=1851148 RepID=A0A1Q2MAT3_9BACT|nr:PQQ-binding-like beta-propeller repeat protein [Limihaloglobus sulfuriphilus]AQQ69769.1 outer membrane biogenesis protein BamB [Limihaloglobus sulfuriphilus]
MNTDTQNSYQKMKIDTAFRAAVVSGAAALIVAGMLAVNYLQIRLLDPMRAERLEAMKLQLSAEPQNQQLVTAIRELDVQVREDKFRRQRVSVRGSAALIVLSVVFIAAVKYVSYHKSRLPHPGHGADNQQSYLRRTMLARWLLAGTFAGIAVVLILGREPGQAGEGEQLSPIASEQELQENWPSFRGRDGRGYVSFENVPQSWNGASGENILWKSPLHLPGHNSPVVWQDKVFLSGADKTQRQIYCYSADDGTLLWQADVPTTSSAEQIEDFDMEEGTGYAAPTLVTDGRRVCGIFPTGDIGCFDMDGKLIWNVGLGIPDSMYGYASSLAIYKGVIIVLFDQAMAEDNKSSIIGFDAISGVRVWETPRPVPNSWGSPVVVKVSDAHQLLTCGDPWLISYDPATGDELWRADCLGTDVAPIPIYAGGYAIGTHPYSKIVAVDPGGTGDVTETHIKWTASGSIPDTCSPTANDEFILTLDSAGYLGCFAASDGEMLWEQELKGGFTASPSLAGNTVYILSENGVMHIADITEGYKELNKCELGEKCYASPAFMDGRIYIRGVDNLYCIESGG